MKIRGYFRLLFIMAEVVNLDTCLGVTLMAKVSNLLEKITDPMAIMIGVTQLMAGCFWFLWEFVEFFYFLDYPPGIIGGFILRLQRNLQLVIVWLG